MDRDYFQRLAKEGKENKVTDEVSSTESSQSDNSNRSAGKQIGSKGFGRSEIPVPEKIIPHYPGHCVICNKEIHISEEIQ